MKKLLALIKTTGKSRKQIREAVMSALKRKKILGDDGKMQLDTSKKQSTKPDNYENR